jgi:hypothetical protein
VREFGVTIAVVRVLGAIAGCALALPATAGGDDPRPAAAIQDNSFLIEEAYNQEAGVVQHISTLRAQGGDVFFNFTQEWPVHSQRHQFSYSIPYSWLGPGNAAEQTLSDLILNFEEGGASQQGFGDVMLNYRWQALFENEHQPAFAPRVSLILPTGDRDKDLGNESFGYQINLPASKIVSDRVTMHGNAGLTSYVDVDGRQPTIFNLGGSAIYAVNREFNLMIEMLGEWVQSVDEGEIESEFVFTVSPGVRYAFNFSDAQLVLGVAAPMSFAKEVQDYGAFLYLSYEHSFMR